MVSRVPLHHHFRQNGGLSRHAREIIYPHILRTPGGFAWPCACTHTTATGALWQSSPTPAPLNYSRHAVESFTQSFSYINATQRDWSAARSVSRASSRPFRHGRGGNEGETFSNGGWGWCGVRGGRGRMQRLLYFTTRDPVCIVTLLISRYIVMMTI